MVAIFHVVELKEDVGIRWDIDHVSKEVYLLSCLKIALKLRYLNVLVSNAADLEKKKVWTAIAIVERRAMTKNHRAFLLPSCLSSWRNSGLLGTIWKVDTARA